MPESFEPIVTAEVSQSDSLYKQSKTHQKKRNKAIQFDVKIVSFKFQKK